MDEASYQAYREESGDWLKSARSELLRDLIVRYGGRGENRRVLEVGAGVGQNIPVLATFGDVDAVEIDPVGRSEIEKQAIVSNLYAQSIPFDLDARYDIVCALDVIEHIEDAKAATAWMSAVLKPGGLLVLMVPAYQWLFSDHDRVLRHFRRYTRKRLQADLPDDVSTLELAYFTHLLFPLAVASRWAWQVKSIMGVGKDADDDALRAIVPNHPVFQIVEEGR